MSDDKTRVLTADEVALLAAPAATKVTSAPPRLVGGKIVFFCPKGHKIVVDRGWAGKKGTCSKAGCNAPVVIPAPPGAEPVPEPAAPAADVTPDEPADASAPEAAVENPAPAAAIGSDEAETHPAAAAPPAVGWDFGAEAAPSVGDAPADVGFDPATEAVGWGGIDIEELENPAARLVARLWLERAHGGIVEVHLSGGSVIMPEWFEPRWSCGTHALFAAQAADGTVTLTAVAWDQVLKVVVRQVQGTPEGMF